MLPILFVMMTTVGGFSYRAETIFDRTKRVKTAPSGYAPTWNEHVEAIVATHRKDADFSRFMRRQAIRSRRDYYRGDAGGEHDSFETWADAGSVEITEAVLSASPDIVSANIGTTSYIAGTPHPNIEGTRTFNWSRRLHRMITQDDVFAIAPDRALRRLAQSKFDHPDKLQNADDADGIPLSWSHASIGPNGITWSFAPYELGGYVSAGDATVNWSALRPYLRRSLPFLVGKIRATRGGAGRGR